MPISVHDVMRLLCSISENKKMRLAFKLSLGDVLITTVCAGIGLFLGGFQGLAFGSVLGGLLAVVMMEETFKPVSKIVLQLSHVQQQKLFNEVKSVIWNLDWIENVELMDLVMRNERIQKQLAYILVDFIRTELKTDVQFGTLPLGARPPQE